MDASNLRIRLVFGNGVLNKYQKKDGLKHSWLLLKPHFQTISDIVSYILHSFDLHDSCPYGIILSMDGFVLPEFESTSILEDKDLISVKRKVSRLLDADMAIEEAKTCIEAEIVENLPLASGVKLLENEEFDRETEGYQSETDKGEDEAVKRKRPVQKAPKRDSASKKRKASDNLKSSAKKRKLQAVVNTVPKKHAHDSENISKPSKKRKHEKSSQNALSSPDVTEKCIDGLKPESNAESELDENRGDTMQEAAIPVKKVSRSTRRKRLIRLWKRSNRDKAKNDEECDKQQQVKDMTTDTGSKKDMMVENTIQQYDEDSDAEGDLVPVVIRPGLIRFTPSGKVAVKDAQENQEANHLDVHSTQNGTWKDHSAPNNVSDAKHNQVTTEAYCWNGITNKRKGQKWGQEMQPNSAWKETNGNTHSSSTWNCRKQSTSSWKDSKDVNGHYSNTWTDGNHSTSSWQDSGNINGQSDNTWADEKHHLDNKSVDFDKLIPLIDVPKAGDIVAYRLLELSSSWCPELSSFRVGKITSFEPDSNKVILAPVLEYPLNLVKNDDDDDDDDDEQPLGSSAYDEDGSLETDFTSLNDVRIMKLGDLTQSEGTRIPATNHTSSPSTSKRVNEAQDPKKVASDVISRELHNPKPANGKKDAWEEIAEAVSAKKAQLMQEDSWDKKETPAKRPWSYRSLRGSAIGPVMARLREKNGA